MSLFSVAVGASGFTLLATVAVLNGESVSGIGLALVVADIVA